MNRYQPLRWVTLVWLSVFALGCTAEVGEDHNFTQEEIWDSYTLNNGDENGVSAADAERADIASPEAMLGRMKSARWVSHNVAQAVRAVIMSRAGLVQQHAMVRPRVASTSGRIPSTAPRTRDGSGNAARLVPAAGT